MKVSRDCEGLEAGRRLGARVDVRCEQEIAAQSNNSTAEVLMFPLMPIYRYFFGEYLKLKIY